MNQWICFLTVLTVAIPLWARGPVRNEEESVREFRRGRARQQHTKRSAWNRQIQVKAPIYEGDGCPQNSASITLSDDKRILSVLFDKFIVESSGGVRSGRASCRVAVPFEVPAGYKLKLLGADYRGFINAEAGTLGRITATQLLSSYEISRQNRRRSVRSSMSFRGPISEEYTISTEPDYESQLTSPCGRSVIMYLNTEVDVLAKNASQIMMTVDSLDATSAFVDFHLIWEECSSGGSR